MTLKDLYLNDVFYKENKKKILIDLFKDDNAIKNKLKLKTSESSLFLYYIETLLLYQETDEIYYYRKLVKLVKNPQQVYTLLNFYYNIGDIYKYNKEERRWYKYDNNIWVRQSNSFLVEVDLYKMCEAFFPYSLYNHICKRSQLLRQLKLYGKN